MRQEDRKLMLESLYDAHKIQIPYDVNVANIMPDIAKKEQLLGNSMDKRVRTALKMYEKSHPNVIPFKQLKQDYYLLDIDKNGYFRLGKKLNLFTSMMNAYENFGILYYYNNIDIGVAVHDHTGYTDVESYNWYFVPISDYSRGHSLYYTCCAYYKEYGITQFLLKLIDKLNAQEN